MSEEIEYFKRFSKAYMRWTHHNFDRIVTDVIKRDAEAEALRKEELRYKDIMINLPIYVNLNKITRDVMKDSIIYGSLFWKTEFNKDAKIGDLLRINIPKDYILSNPKSSNPSLISRILNRWKRLTG